MNSKAQKFAQEEDCSLLGQCFCKKSFSFDDKEIFEFGKWYYYFYDNDHRGLKSVKESWWVMYDFDGDIEILRVSIVSTKDQLHTVTDQVMNIELYEDIFSPFLSGKILFRDSHEFTSLLPFTGEEVLVLWLNTPGLNIEYKHSFFIYKMGERNIVSQDNETYTLYFMSKEGALDQNRKISKGYSGLIAKERPDPKSVPGSGDVTDIDPKTTTTYPCIVESIISDPLSLANIENKPVFIETSES